MPEFTWKATPCRRFPRILNWLTRSGAPRRSAPRIATGRVTEIRLIPWPRSVQAFVGYARVECERSTPRTAATLLVERASAEPSHCFACRHPVDPDQGPAAAAVARRRSVAASLGRRRSAGRQARHRRSGQGIGGSGLRARAGGDTWRGAPRPPMDGCSHVSRSKSIGTCGEPTRTSCGVPLPAGPRRWSPGPDGRDPERASTLPDSRSACGSPRSRRNGTTRGPRERGRSCASRGLETRSLARRCRRRRDRVRLWDCVSCRMENGFARILVWIPQLTERLALDLSEPVEGAAGFYWLGRQHGVRAKTQFVARKLVPPADFMRFKYRSAHNGKGGLARAYFYRLLWIAGRALPGFLSWRRSRREARMTDRAPE